MSQPIRKREKSIPFVRGKDFGVEGGHGGLGS